MEDDKIHELVDRKQNETYDRVENTIRVLTDFVAIENQGIKKSIDDLTKTVKEQNSSVKALKEWKARIEGGQNALKEAGDKSGRWLTQVIMGIGVLAAVCFGVVNSCSSNKLKEDVDNKLYWKEDRMPDSTVRSITTTPITEDTIWQQKFLKTKKYMK